MVHSLEFNLFPRKENISRNVNIWSPGCFSLLFCLWRVGMNGLDLDKDSSHSLVIMAGRIYEYSPHYIVHPARVRYYILHFICFAL